MANKNLIQVFGLPRSGTNFVEWSLKHNFIDVPYKNIYVNGNVKGLREYGKTVALKHNYPSLDYSDFIIVIYKEYEAWKMSMSIGLHDGKSRGPATKEVYDSYLDSANNLPKDKVMVISYKDLYENYSEYMVKISNKFGVELAKEIKKPKNKLDGGGANVKETEKPFKL